MILTYILYYIAIGVCWSFILELINDKDVKGHEHIHITNAQRIVNVILWPYSLFIFIITFIRILNEKN